MNLLEIQKKQDKERSVANLAAILNLLDVQICLEKDPEILAILTSQKTTMNKILIQKQSGKKGSFKTTEKEAISQLQNQVSCLEKSVDKKFETILESIKNNQSTTNFWAQIAAQSIQKEQEQQQKLTITKEQKQAPKQQPKTQAKREAAAQYMERRLVLHISQQIWAKFDGYRLRNQINDAFLQKEKAEKPIAASVVKSLTGQSIIVTTMPDYTADFLIEKRQVWEKSFSPYLKSMEKGVEWSKLIIHGIPIAPFSMDDGLFLLKEEIETFNPEVKLLKNPRWLSSEEYRQNKRHASIAIIVENAEQAKAALQKKFLYIAGSQLEVVKFKSDITKTQCQKCQRIEHITKFCPSKDYCQICAAKHNTRQHTCNICNTKDVECAHTKLKCRNCGEKHRANSRQCSIWEEQTSKTSNSNEVDVQMKNTPDFEVVISNNGVWE
jgi:hypothetical protein